MAYFFGHYTLHIDQGGELWQGQAYANCYEASYHLEPTGSDAEHENLTHS